MLTAGRSIVTSFDKAKKFVIAVANDLEKVKYKLTAREFLLVITYFTILH